jgi:hypothetical protein
VSKLYTNRNYVNKVSVLNHTVLNQFGTEPSFDETTQITKNYSYMRTNDYLLLLLTTMLKRATSAEGIPLDWLKDQPSANFIKLRNPNERSVGFYMLDGSTISAEEGFNLFRSESIQSSKVVLLSPQTQNLPEHVLAAFENTSTFAIHVTTSVRDSIFLERTHRSPKWAITGAELVELLNAQSCKGPILKIAHEKISEYNKLNALPAVAASEIQEYVQDAELPDHIMQDLLLEAKVECKMANVAFIVPEMLKAKLESLEPFRSSPFCWNFVPKISGKEYVTLLDAQTNQDKIADQALRFFSEYANEFSNPKDYHELREKIREMNSEQIDMKFGWLIVDIISSSVGTPIVPEHLKTKFTHQKIVIEGNPRATVAANIYEKSYWVLAQNKIEWEVIGFHEFKTNDYTAEHSLLDEAKADFKSHLEKTLKFSERMGTPFAEAFRLSLLVMSDPFFSTGPFDDNFYDKIDGVLKFEDFTSTANSFFKKLNWIFRDLEKLNITPKIISVFFAISTIQTLYGGMGSWNDQVFATEADKLEYEKCSEDLYHSMKMCFLTILNEIS